MLAKAKYYPRFNISALHDGETLTPYTYVSVLDRMYSPLGQWVLAQEYLRAVSEYHTPEAAEARRLSPL